MTMHQQAITIPNTSSGSSLPNTSGSGNRGHYSDSVVRLYEASILGDWDTAELIFNQHPDLVASGITKNLDTALHVAATAKESHKTINFVKNLVQMMNREDLKLRNGHFNNAFCIACASGKIEMAKIMWVENQSLLDIRGKDDYLPLSIAVKTGSSDIAKWLYEKSQKMSSYPWKDNDRDLTLSGCVENDMFDLALEILNDRKELAKNVSLLEVLARKPEAFKGSNVRSNRRTKAAIAVARIFGVKQQPATEDEEDSNALKVLKIIWKHTTRTLMDIDKIEDFLRGPPTNLSNGTIQYSSRILFIAAEKGNLEFIVELLLTYHHLMLDKNDKGLTIFHIAVMRRHHCIYNLLHEIDDDSKRERCISHDNEGNNMLHLVGKTSKDVIAKSFGTYFVLPQELMWFEEVKRMIPSYLWDAENKKGQTPYELLAVGNEDLVSKGLKVIKDCMLIATIIVTVAFATAFTIPGGYDQITGFPVFIYNPSLIFVIANAISLITSSCSLLVFMSVLSSNVNQIGLIRSLSERLVWCLNLITISIGAMLLTFVAGFSVLYQNKSFFLWIFISASAIIPIGAYVVSQNLINQDIYYSVYAPRRLFMPRKHMLYTTKSRLP